MTGLFRMAAVLTFALAPGLCAADGDPLPSPLTLDAALRYADRPHPDLDLREAQLSAAQAARRGAESTDGVRVNLDAALARGRPSLGGGDVGDNFARLLATKPLYDFGRTRAAEAAATAAIAARQDVLLNARAARRIDIMARFFDVVLADLRYAVDNEEMARRYVNFDRVRRRHRLGAVSDVDLMAAEDDYRIALDARTASQKRQAAVRLRLALALNRPDSIPSEVERPRLKGLEREPPEYDTALKQALSHNPTIHEERARVEQARELLAGARARRRPVLSGEVEAGHYQRPFATRYDYRGALVLRVPLYQGGEDDALIAGAQAQLQEREAVLAKAEQSVREAVLDLVQRLETLKVERETARKRVAYRDLYLDRGRALYDMEVQTNLGDAMVRLTEAQYQKAKTDFDTALTWARLDALTGAPIPDHTKTP